MLFDGFDVLFNIAFALIFCSVFIILAYGIITSITTWNKNNHSPQLMDIALPHPLPIM